MDADCSGVGRVIYMDQLGLVVVLVAKPWTQLVSSTRISIGINPGEKLSVILACDSGGGKLGPGALGHSCL